MPLMPLYCVPGDHQDPSGRGVGAAWDQRKRRPAVEWENTQVSGQGKKAGGWMRSHQILVQVGMPGGWNEWVKESRQVVGE